MRGHRLVGCGAVCTTVVANVAPHEDERGGSGAGEGADVADGVARNI